MVLHELSLEETVKTVGRNEDEAASQSQGRKRMLCVWGVGRLGENVFSPVSPTQLISAAVL